MGATGPRIAPRAAAIAAVAIALLASVQLRGDQPAEVRSVLASVAQALSAGTAADAIASFDKSFAHYDELSNFFAGLTSAYSITNEVDVVDETDEPNDSHATIRWRLTLTDPETRIGESRASDLTVRLVAKDGKWKIVDLAPVQFFNPAHAVPR